MRPLIVAIDGPSGAGKGTLARGLARALGYRHVDTGAMYRAVAWLALRKGLSLDVEGPLAEIARDARIDLADDRVAIEGEDVTRAIRTPEIDRAAARVARWPEVRVALVRRQRALAGGSTGLVMEGRDIGTVVFPDADVKIYLDASPDERARRRAADPAHAGREQGVAAVAVDLEARDAQDRSRRASPLTIAPDAHVIDTTGVPIDDVVAWALALVREKAAARAEGAEGEAEGTGSPAPRE